MALFEKSNQNRILVIGDIMIDRYIHGSVNRISPEAPVPVVAVEHTEDRLGGAANVALNVRTLGAACDILSVTGEDSASESLKQQLLQHEIGTYLIPSKRPTTVKTRVLAKGHHIVRIDDETTEAIDSATTLEFMKQLQLLLQSQVYKAVILQDYNKGVFHSNIETILYAIRQYNIPVFVDPKQKHFLNYTHVFCFKPNLKELYEGFPSKQIDLQSVSSIIAHAETLRKHISAAYVFVTLSERGSILVHESGHTHIPAFQVSRIADVSGAGDSVIASIAVAYACGLEMELSAHVATLSGGLVCQEPGVIPIQKSQLEVACAHFQLTHA